MLICIVADRTNHSAIGSGQHVGRRHLSKPKTKGALVKLPKGFVLNASLNYDDGAAVHNFLRNNGIIWIFYIQVRISFGLFGWPNYCAPLRLVRLSHAGFCPNALSARSGSFSERMSKLASTILTRQVI